MKKLTALSLTLALLCSLAACGGTPTQSETPTPADTTPVETPEAPTPTPEATPEPVESEEPVEATTRVLVACFSATGNTLPLAEYIAEELGADLYEIMPETPYTTEDLNWHDSTTRATTEQNDDTARPAISGSVDNMEDYDVIFLGYPIWWGQAPKIMYTFLESYDLSGKTIVPFCTSGSSGMGSSATNLHPSADGATWLEGRRFSAGTSRETMAEWVNSLGLTITA